MSLIDHPEGRILSQSERGWRFFTWAGIAEKTGDTYCPQGEKEVSSEMPLSRLVCHMEDQLAGRLVQAGMPPIENLDVCFHQQKISREGKQLLRADDADEAWTAGSVTVNVDDRIQMVLWVDPDHLRKDSDRFVQTFCHEYCHALFVRACLTSAGNMDFSDAAVKRANDVLQGDIIADEALANAFAMLHARQITLYIKKNLTYDQLLESSDEYADAYSLSRILCALIADVSSSADNFIYRAARILADDATKEMSIFECLRQAIENDPAVNPGGLSFRDLYMRTDERIQDGSLPAPAIVV